MFQLLLRQPWWVTVLVAFAIFWVGYAVFPPIAPFVASPFVLLGGYIAFKQWRSGVPSDPAQQLKSLREMSWENFSAVVSEAYRRQGYQVTPSNEQAYDFSLSKSGRVTLLQCRRWKVNQVGAGPVRDLAQAVDRKNAYKGICLAAGEFSAPARKVAAAEPVELVTGTELAALLKPLTRSRRWFRR
ncbi:MAG: restriction endonuclease [Burkholderiales bacterium]